MGPWTVTSRLTFGVAKCVAQGDTGAESPDTWRGLQLDCYKVTMQSQAGSSCPACLSVTRLRTLEGASGGCGGTGSQGVSLIASSQQSPPTPASAKRVQGQTNIHLERV